MKPTIKDYFIYFIYRIFQFLFLILPNLLIKRLLKVVAFLAYKFNKKHNKIALANLNLVYEDTISFERKQEIIYNSYKSLAFNMYEFIENQHIDKEQLFSKAKLINGEVIQKAHDEKRKVIYITAHYGGWELTLPYMALKYGEIAVVNRKMENPLVNRQYEIGRSKNFITMLEKKVAAKGMLKAFKDDKSIAVVIDQHIGNGSEVTFLGKKDIATDSTSRLALKFDAVIIPIFTVCDDFREYTIKVCEPIDVTKVEFKTDNHIDELTQMQTDLVSKQIFEYPDCWFWQHKRFKKYHRDIYDK